MLLTAITVAVLAETLRVLFPLLYHFAEQLGFVSAAGIIPLIFLAPFAANVPRSLVGGRAMLALSVVGIFACRVAMQVTQPGLVLAASGSMFGFVAVGSLVEVSRAEPHGDRPGGRAFAGAVAAGLMLDTAIRLAFATWDVAWQSGPWPWTACLGLVVAGIGALAAFLARPARPAFRGGYRGPGSGSAQPRAPRPEARPDTAHAGSTPPVSFLPLAAFGAFLALELLVFASPALVASSAGVSLAVAGGTVLVGFAAALVGLAIAHPPRWPRAQPVAWGAGVACWAVLAIRGLGTSASSASLLLGVVVLGQVWVVSLLALAVRAALAAPAAPAGRGSVAGWTRGWRSGSASGLASILFVAILLPYQIHYELPLPVPNWVLPPVAALVLGLAARRGARWQSPRPNPPRSPGSSPPRAPRLALAGAVAALAALASPLALGLTAGSSAAGPVDGSFRLVSYNIHEAVNTRGHLDPAAVARVIERQDADVVLLQEVGRGWPLSGTMDVGAWLARRLDMRLVYGPAADRQFGNAVLTDLPVEETWRGRLPRGGGSMRRGYVAATVEAGRSEVEVWSTHLQHQDTTRTRIAEIETLLGAWAGDSPAIIAGDFNARPGSPEMRAFLRDTGLRSAQDRAGDPAAPTCCWPRVDHRIDWILGTPDLRFSAFAIPPARASDHLPLAVTVHVPDDRR